MPEAIKVYVRFIDRVNRAVGRFAMYLVFLMMAILFYSTISKNFFTPSLWTLEMAQFTMVAYYMLGGGYSMQLDAHVRMDLLFDRWSDRTRAIVDAFTICFLVVYLGFLLYSGLSSTEYALKTGETSRKIWDPYMAPIKIIMVVAILLMLLQTIAAFFRSLATAMRKPLDG
jgi:TRAP-type mannitol/chloroaromatic compound transport system permease small subunit